MSLLSRVSEGGRRFFRGAIGAERWKAARSVYRLATRNEMRSPYPLSLKLWAWRRGFTAQSASLYDRAGTDAGNYLTDYQRDFLCAKLNPIPAMTGHKLILRGVLAARGVPQPELIAFVSQHGILVDLDADA